MSHSRPSSSCCLEAWACLWRRVPGWPRRYLHFIQEHVLTGVGAGSLGEDTLCREAELPGRQRSALEQKGQEAGFSFHREAM